VEGDVSCSWWGVLIEYALQSLTLAVVLGLALRFAGLATDGGPPPSVGNRRDDT
jgi:hypothetical protein